jgi:hypothetical protein
MTAGIGKFIWRPSEAPPTARLEVSCFEHGRAGMKERQPIRAQAFNYVAEKGSYA